ncbi:MAG: hypothetical protein R3244_03680 [Thermoanaerobaculia bacterium]|nr:hypothetical protein [Thermoanaerobaculia bacterium]
MAYEVTNVSRGPLYENLDTKDVQGNLEVLNLGVRQKATLTDKQWASASVQRHIRRKRLRSRKLS